MEINAAAVNFKYVGHDTPAGIFTVNVFRLIVSLQFRALVAFYMCYLK